MIGVVGGGQLAMLLVEAGKKRDVDVVVQTAAKTDPAAKKTNQVILYDPTNPLGTKLLAEKSRFITFENEWIDITSLLSLQNNKVSFVPSLQSIRPLINKITQRELLNSLDIPCPDWLAGYPLAGTSTSFGVKQPRVKAWHKSSIRPPTRD